MPGAAKSQSDAFESVPGGQRGAPFQPESAEEIAAVREQLDRILAHPLFANSKRYPSLLRFVVEQTLDGGADQLKERLIGIEVFGRTPDYDANADPVVRVTAGETRKRLAQYYYDPEHGGELRIELPTGAYLPQFVRPAAESASRDRAMLDRAMQERAMQERAILEPTTGQPSATQTGPSPQPVLPTAAKAAEPLQMPAPAAAHPLAGHMPWEFPQFWHPRHGQHPGRGGHHYSGTTVHLVVTVLMVVAALGAGVFAGYRLHAPRPQAPVDHTVEDFWQPVTAGDSTVTICLGEPARDTSDDGDWSKPIPHTVSTEPLYVHIHLSGLFALADVVTLTRVEVPLLAQHKPFRVTAASEASFGELREGPVVLIGAFDNLWVMRLSRDLRFGFDSSNGTALIVDRKSNKRTTWASDWDQPYERLSKDYAIIARFRDQVTGQPVMMVSGISEEGTEAAGELISNANDLKQLLKNAPPNWRSMNMEAVIETQVIEGHAGPPTVRAVEFWP